MTSAWDTQTMERCWPELLAAVQAENYQWVMDDEGQPEHGSIGVSGPSADLTAGHIDNEALRHYGWGQCGILAYALLDLALASRLALCVRSSASRPFEDESWCHLLVALEDGRLIDIHGVRDEHELCTEWERFHSVREPVELVDINIDEARRLCGDARIDISQVEWQLARTMAATLLRSAGVEPCNMAGEAAPAPRRRYA
jgi:hypothetical protein